MTPLRIGTRGSPLALWQANHVAALLRPLAGPRAVELVEIQTAGDRDRATSLTVLGGQGIFTKEIQQALLDGRVDVAVHSLKDLPTVPIAGLCLAAVPERAPVADAFVSTRHASFAALPEGATVASSSLRRRAQLLNRRPDLKLAEIRGNVETRLRKLDEQGLDAIVLAEAGLLRLGLAGRVTERLAWMVPAIGQGALGLECRADDAVTRGLLARLDDPATHAAVRAERALLRELGGGCQVPIGGAATLTGGVLTLRGVVLSPDGTERIEGTVTGGVDEAEALGGRLAAQMLERGARSILQSSPLLPPLEVTAMSLLDPEAVGPLDPKALLGLTVEEAARLCQAANRACRVLVEDGVSYPATADLRHGRCNFVVEQGKVVAVDVEGEGHASA